MRLVLPQSECIFTDEEESEAKNGCKSLEELFLPGWALAVCTGYASPALQVAPLPPLWHTAMSQEV